MNTLPQMPYTCATCRWWVRGKKLNSGHEVPGQCRRNPPAFTPGGSRWPATEAHEWCGEHHRLWEETKLLERKGNTPAGPVGDNKPADAAVLSTGGAEPDGAKAPAEAGHPTDTKPGAFARPPRRR